VINFNSFNMSPSKVSSIKFDEFYNIVDGKQRSAKNFHNGIDPTTGQKSWDVSTLLGILLHLSQALP
jgi:hypothetical protein